MSSAALGANRSSHRNADTANTAQPVCRRPRHSVPALAGLPLLREIKLNSGLAALELDALVARLHELAVAAIPGVGVLNALQRRLLGGLAERGLVVREDNSACLRSVAYQQAGEAMLAALAGAPEEQRQAYRQPGFTLRDLVQALLQRRLLSTGTVGKTEYLWCQLWWLPAGCTAAAAPRPPSQQRAEPLPPGAQPAATPLSGVQEVELAPQPALSKGKLSPSNAIMFFHQALSLLLPGASQLAGPPLAAAVCGSRVVGAAHPLRSLAPLLQATTGTRSCSGLL